LPSPVALDHALGLPVVTHRRLQRLQLTQRHTSLATVAGVARVGGCGRATPRGLAPGSHHRRRVRDWRGLAQAHTTATACATGTGSHHGDRVRDRRGLTPRRPRARPARAHTTAATCATGAGSHHGGRVRDWRGLAQCACPLLPPPPSLPHHAARPTHGRAAQVGLAEVGIQVDGAGAVVVCLTVATQPAAGHGRGNLTQSPSPPLPVVGRASLGLCGRAVAVQLGGEAGVVAGAVQRQARRVVVHRGLHGAARGHADGRISRTRVG
jgi:hypothetical protein